jgi:hypothetical protein
MIRTALEFIKGELEAYMVTREQDSSNYQTGNVVDLKPIILPNGDVNITDTTHVTIMLVGIEEERREGKHPLYIPAADKELYRLNPPTELVLFLLFVANNSYYPTALRDLSNVIGFFQANPVFDATNFPALNANVIQPENKPWQMIDRLSFLLYNSTFEQQNNIWATLGAKYMASVVYKMSMLTVFETKSKEKATVIGEVDFQEN